MPGNGKIARLTPEIREQLSCRLEKGETGKALVRWLNQLPEVKAILATRFHGKPINEVNLCKWKAHGHRQWLARCQAIDDARKLSRDAAELTQLSPERLTDNLAQVLAGRYAAAIADWNGESSQEFRRKIRDLRSLCRDVTELRRGDHRAARIDLTCYQMELQATRETLGNSADSDAGSKSEINPKTQQINPN